MAIRLFFILMPACLWAVPLRAAPVEPVRMAVPAAGAWFFAAAPTTGLALRQNLTASVTPSISLTSALSLSAPSVLPHSLVPRVGTNLGLAAEPVVRPLGGHQTPIAPVFDSLDRLASQAEAARRSGANNSPSLAPRFFDRAGDNFPAMSEPPSIKLYQVVNEKGETVRSPVPGRYAGWGPGKIFGRLDCKSGMRMKKKNRVFFTSWAAAVNAGYRPCKNCKPTPLDSYPGHRHPALRASPAQP
jgi:hypothetical protein